MIIIIIHFKLGPLFGIRRRGEIVFINRIGSVALAGNWNLVKFRFHSNRLNGLLLSLLIVTIGRQRYFLLQMFVCPRLYPALRSRRRRRRRCCHRSHNYLYTDKNIVVTVLR